MGTTDIFKLPWPELVDPADGPDGFQDLAVASEVALKLQTVRKLWTVRRNQNNAVPVATWGNVVDITIPNAEAPVGLYMVLAAVSWTGWSCWHRVQFNGVNAGDYVTSTNNQTQTFSDQVTPVLATYQHTGGSLRVDIDFGFGAADVTIKAGSLCTVSYCGNGPTAATSSDPAFVVS